MGWSHPDISLEDLMALIKGFVDILILASGYQSSGLPAAWDAHNINNAIRWGRFFEEVFRRVQGSVYYEDSVKELDAALLKLTSDSCFPQGLSHMSSATLSCATQLVLKHFLQAQPVEDAHLLAVLTAVIEMDLENLSKTDNDSPYVYADKLMMQMESLHLAPTTKGFVKDSEASLATAGFRISSNLQYTDCSPKMITKSVGSKDCSFIDHSCFIIQELLKRQALVSCISSVNAGLDNLSNIFSSDVVVGSEKNSCEGKMLNDISPKNEELLVEIRMWNQWRSRCISYMLDTRTIRLLSGANLIFSAPKVQWTRVFEPLKVSIDAHNDNISEIMEILMLGSISSRWHSLIEHFILHSCNYLPISNQYSSLRSLIRGNTQSLHSSKEVTDSKENDILEYVMQLLGTQPHKLWQLPPILAAAAMPLRSNLFKMYFTDIERQFTEASSSLRCCHGSEGRIEHRDCEVAERIRCLYVFNIEGNDDGSLGSSSHRKQQSGPAWMPFAERRLPNFNKAMGPNLHMIATSDNDGQQGFTTIKDHPDNGMHVARR